MLLLILLLTILPRFSHEVNEYNRVKMSIYYESLCGDSVNFIKNQLAPNYEAIKKYVDLDFIPFGKATHSRFLNDWQFTCQHGPNECDGNIMQACGLEYAENQDDKVKFVNCTMTSKDPSKKQTIKKCALSSGIGWNKFSDCYNTKKGKELLAQHGDRTYNVQPSITYIPTIIFNGVYDYYLQYMAMQNLKGIVMSLANTKCV